jgi:hypothetical protein
MKLEIYKLSLSSQKLNEIFDLSLNIDLHFLLRSPGLGIKNWHHKSVM